MRLESATAQPRQIVSCLQVISGDNREPLRMRCSPSFSNSAMPMTFSSNERCDEADNQGPYGP